MKILVKRSTAAERLATLRHSMRVQSLDGFLVPRADEHLGEYVPSSAERLAWLTGFTGSAGLAVVLTDRAAVFTDGRYTLQLAAQADPACFELHHLIESPPPAWIGVNTAPGARIGYDPMLISEEGLARYKEAGLTLVPADPNPLDAAWHDRPAPPGAIAVPHPLRYAGKPSAEKRAEIGAALRAAKTDAAVITDPASIAWLLNIRGGDVDYTPFALGFLLIDATETATLFMDPAKVPQATRDWLGNAVTVRPRAELDPALGQFAGKRVQVDTAGSPAWFAQRLRARGTEVVDATDPCALPKACKNEIEQDGARAAHRRDAVALCRFLHWFDAVAPRNTTTEQGAAERLLAFRREVADFRGESFPAISGAGEHGAIIHYRVSAESDRPIRPDEAYLIDSGAQYPDGTTDVTRTLWTGPGAAPAEVRDRVTRVLQGHIALATTIFPQGVSGPHLDAFARRALWQAGLDYDHGTGHGVGSYLSVHEGPASLSRAGRTVPLAAGMILSDEPGFYEPGHYGIRLENLLLVRPAAVPHARKPFLAFEVLTLAPFDRRLLEPSLLGSGERDWLDAYHARVLREVGPDLDRTVRQWLAEACRPL
ncbi:MAG: aminopeptidase P family protein [Acetobacteraceae bacterium]